MLSGAENWQGSDHIWKVVICSGGAMPQISSFVERRRYNYRKNLNAAIIADTYLS
jgi:hypothetical protein